MVVHEDKVLLGGTHFVRRSDVLDACTLRDDIRKADFDEWRYSVAGGVAHLETCIISSDECWTVADDMDRALIIAGVVADPSSAYGDVTWLIGTNAAEHIGLPLMQAARPIFDGFFERWPKTTCISWAGNHKHHRWLRWLGYRQFATLKWGPVDELFYRFIKERIQ